MKKQKTPISSKSSKYPKISLFGKFKYWDLERDVNRSSQPITEKNLNTTFYTKETTRLTREKWIEINERLRRRKISVCLSFSGISAIFLLILGLTFNFTFIPQALLFVGFTIILTALNALIWLWWFLKSDKKYKKLKKEKTNEPTNTSQGTGYFLTDERLPHKSKPWEAEKHFASTSQLSEGMWIVRYQEIPQNKKALTKWINEISSNFIFDYFNAPSLDSFWNSIIHPTFDDEGSINIPFTSANDVIRKVQNYLLEKPSGKFLKYATSSSKKEFVDKIYNFCFAKSKLKAFRYQTGYDKDTGSDQPNAIVIGMTGSGKTQTLNIPTILANANSSYQPSMVILDPKGELQLKYAPWMKNAGYEVSSINVFNPSASQSWNPLEELYRIALTISILKDLEKQFVNHKRFFSSTYKSDTQEVIQENPVVDFRLENLQLGQIGSTTCDPLTPAEYILMQRRYEKLGITKDNFQFDPNLFETNDTYLSSPQIQPKFIRSNDPQLASLLCAKHNVESLYKQDASPTSAAQHDIDIQIAELKKTKIKRNQQLQYFELADDTSANTFQPTCSVCAPLLSQQNQVLIFDNLAFYSNDHIQDYLSMIKTSRDNYLSIFANSLIPIAPGADPHWATNGQNFLRGVLLRMAYYVEDYPQFIPLEKFNLASVNNIVKSTDFTTDKVFPECSFLEVLNQKISDLIQSPNSSVQESTPTPQNRMMRPNRQASNSLQASQLLSNLTPYQIALLKKRIAEILDDREDYKLLKKLISTEDAGNQGELASIRSQLEGNLAPFMTEGGKKFSSFSSISITRMINAPRPQAMFVSFAVQEPTYHKYLILFLATLANKLSEKAKRSGGTLKRKWMFMMDEFGNLPQFPYLSEILATCRSEGIKWMIILQDYSQLSSKYQQLSDAIESNCPFKIFIKTDNAQTKQKFVQSIAQTTIINEEEDPNTKKIRKQATSSQLISTESLEALHSPSWNECLIATASYKMIVSVPWAYRLYNLELFNKYPQLDYDSKNFNPETNQLSIVDISSLDTRESEKNYLKYSQIVEPENKEESLDQIKNSLLQSDEFQQMEDSLSQEFQKILEKREQFVFVDYSEISDITWEEDSYYIGDVLKEVYGLEFKTKDGKSKEQFFQDAIALGDNIKLRTFINNFDVIFGTKFNFSEAVFDIKIKDIIAGKGFSKWISLSTIQDYVYGFNDQELNDSLIGYAHQIIENDWSLEQIKQELHPNKELEELFRKVFVVINECFTFELEKRIISDQPKVSKFFHRQLDIFDNEINFYNIVLGFVDQFIISNIKTLKINNSFKQLQTSQFFQMKTLKNYIKSRLNFYINPEDPQSSNPADETPRQTPEFEQYRLFIEQLEQELNYFFIKNALIIYSETIF